jgi:hypothetical protein
MLSSIAVPGSGAAEQLFTRLSIIVTAPFSAKALPQLILAPVSMEMLEYARIFPANAVPTPRVAELPTCQKTLPPPSLP